MRLDERLQPQVPCLRDQPRQAPLRVEHGQQQDEVGPGGPEELELPGIDDELLGEDRDGDRRADGAQVVHGAAEPVRLAQDGDGRGTARGVRPSPGDGVVAGGDRARGRRAALDLGDEVQAGAGEGLRDGPGCRGRRHGAPEPVAAEGVQLRADVRQAARGDLVDDVGPS